MTQILGSIQFDLPAFNGSAVLTLPSDIVAYQNQPLSVTDVSTAEGEVGRLDVPAMRVGPADVVYIEALWTHPTDSAISKTLTIRNGSVIVGQSWPTINPTTKTLVEGQMRGLVSQIWNPVQAQPFGQVSILPVTTAFDFSQPQTFSFYGKHGTAGTGSKLITLEWARIRVLRA